MSVHLIKLAVGVEDVEHLARLQSHRIRANALAGLGPYPRHVTRHRPKRAEELIAGGSIYWVIKGQIRARQRIRGFETVDGDDGRTHTAIVLDADLMPTRAKPHRAFQGWRYLDPAKAPQDAASGAGRGGDELPADLASALDDLGLL